MKSLLLALQFLTVIPVRIRYIDEKRISEAVIYFPLIGLLLGLILAVTNNLLFRLGFEQFIINVILIVLLIVLTGGIHLDGLADTCDALLSEKNKDEMLKIMRDSHIGAIGVLSLISIILLKVSFLSSISVPSKIAALLLMCTLSRWSQVFVMFSFPYARQEGKAKIFIQGMNLRIFLLSTLIAFACAVIIWQLSGLLIMGIVALSAYIIGKFIKRKIDGITGDTLGAINELIEVFVLFSICILERINLWII